MQKIAQAAIAVAVGLLLCGAKADAQNINVVINGQPVSFVGTPPQELNGAVLVPLRGVFEQLGAHVQYNPSTKTIFAEKGATSVSLSLGSSTAYVNKQSQQLAQPPTVLVGTTLVPLRFVAEAFGAYVEWEAQTRTVEIQTGPSRDVATAPPSGRPHSAELTTVSARILGIDDSSGSDVLTLGTPDGHVHVNLDDHTVVTVRRFGGPPQPSAPGSLQVGDIVTAQIWPNGNAHSVEIKPTRRHG